MNIRDSLIKAQNTLNCCSKNSALEAEILLSEILKKSREFLFSYPEKKISESQNKKYNNFIARRLKGEPIAYIVGRKEFYGLDFIVNKNVLVPRPETELMVEEAINHITHNTQHITESKNLIIEIGTGSGCIIISLLNELQKSKLSILSTRDYQFFASDISAPALATAKKNAKLHKADKKIKFFKGSLLEPIIANRESRISNRNLIILANLPYVSKKWKDDYLMTVGLKFEPPIALFAGKNGLELYQKLFKQIKEIMNLSPASIFMLCEFDPRQTQEIKKLAKRELPKGEIKIIKDLAGKNRILEFLIN